MIIGYRLFAYTTENVWQIQLQNLLVWQNLRVFQQNQKFLGKVFFSSDCVRVGVRLQESAWWHIATIERFEKSKMASGGHLENGITLTMANNWSKSLCNTSKITKLRSRNPFLKVAFEKNKYFLRYYPIWRLNWWCSQYFFTIQMVCMIIVPFSNI